MDLGISAAHMSKAQTGNITSSSAKDEPRLSAELEFNCFPIPVVFVTPSATDICAGRQHKADPRQPTA